MKFSIELLHQIKQLFDQNYGTRSIAKELGLQRYQIVSAYKELGLYKSELTKNKQNPRKLHLQKERYCVDCKMLKSIDNFNRYFDKARRLRPKSYCIFHENERQNKKYYLRISKDPSYKLRGNISSYIYQTLKNNNISKNNNSILKYLSYSIKELKLHFENQFEPWMTWENWGRYNAKTWNDNDSTTWTWQIDHIIPHSTFKYSSMDCQEFKICWALDNLRPYSAKQNIIDGGTQIRHINI